MAKVYYGTDDMSNKFVGESIYPYRVIKDYCDKMGFNTPYFRSWQIESDITQVDYGSHSNFFFIVGAFEDGITKPEEPKVEYAVVNRYDDVRVKGNDGRDYDLISSGWVETDDSTSTFPRLISKKIGNPYLEDHYNLTFDYDRELVTLLKNDVPLIAMDSGDFDELVSDANYLLRTLSAVINNRYRRDWDDVNHKITISKRKSEDNEND